ncbi:MAG TPA: acetyl-CoA carboxylase biotin carboxylase subunit [Candidatus Thermoplasmatota archaeon]|nr:acetyl-CoA carboxylase biotin carboxylase subunit [Candidatus Thermoplasmatota archaeon]
MFKKVLVANRGEIAVRVIRALRELRVASVAVHSEADRGALHTRLADEAVEIGPAPSAQSYLAMDRVLEAAQRTGAEAIHPGYGFLSENAAFVRRCDKAGIVFVGPSARAMAQLGDKLKARALAKRLGVPLTPGSDGPLASAKDAEKVARRIGYPVLLKAAGGGGGLGMRVVRKPGELAAALDAARAQAEAAFGQPGVFLEKFHERPRHVEVQVLGLGSDAIHLGERECSLQRRYQKLVEEAPSPALNATQRAEVAEQALKLFRAAKYENAGTAEFLMAEGGLYFNEVNARLQVEHPVTEMVTGIDLVHAQLRIAAGQDLGFAQRDVHWRGWAFECRINAEDPFSNFAPSPGKIALHAPPAGPGVRVDAGVESGSVVPAAYDSLVAKLIVHGASRAEALARLRRALGEYRVEGVRTTLPLHRAIAAHKAFAAGKLHTKFLEEHRILEGLERERAHVAQQRRDRVAALAAVMAAKPAVLARLAARDAIPTLAAPPDAWRTAARAEGLRRWPP